MWDRQTIHFREQRLDFFFMLKEQERKHYYHLILTYRFTLVPHLCPHEVYEVSSRKKARCKIEKEGLGPLTFSFSFIQLIAI